VLVEKRGRHGPRITGRITSVSDHTVALATTLGERSLPTEQIKRARTVPALYAPGDPVLKRHVPADTWRGGVVRTEGTDVLVEQVGGDFVWLPEDALEPAGARDPAGPPPLKRGPVPSHDRGGWD
jgi:hypothetical protein